MELPKNYRHESDVTLVTFLIKSKVVQRYRCLLTGRFVKPEDIHWGIDLREEMAKDEEWVELEFNWLCKDEMVEDYNDAIFASIIPSAREHCMRQEPTFINVQIWKSLGWVKEVNAA